jgi:membrane protein
MSRGPNQCAPLRVVCFGSGVPNLKLPFHALGEFSRRRAPQRRVTPRQQSGAVVSPAEYWTFLCAAGLLAIAVAMPKTPDGRGKLAKRPASGAFGTTRSTDEPQVVQHKRAHEPGRGRRADAPWQIPWRGWKDILWRTYQQIGEDRLLAVAAGVVFYGLLALFPALTAIVSLYGLFANAATITDHLSIAAGILPGGAIDVIREQVARLVSKGDARLGFGFILGLGIALWSANAGMKAIIDALNVVYDEKEKRGFIKLNLVSLAFTLAAVAALLLALGAVVVLPLLLGWLGFATVTASLVQYARWPVLLVLVIAGLALIYRFGPSRREARWQWLSVGSVFAAVAWLVSSALLSWYLGSFAHYDATYGSLGAAIGMMMWMWISSIVILFGAQLNSEIEHQTARDSTVEHDKPLGARGAVMADTVGAARSQQRKAG